MNLVGENTVTLASFLYSAEIGFRVHGLKAVYFIRKSKETGSSEGLSTVNLHLKLSLTFSAFCEFVGKKRY